MLNLLSHWYLPLSKAILHRCEFGKLALPVRKESESFGVTILRSVSLGQFPVYAYSAYLVKFAIIAADKHAEILVEFLEYPLPRIVPESRIFTVFLASVLEGEIQVCKV
jgi:hypothetical protein